MQRVVCCFENDGLLHLLSDRRAVPLAAVVRQRGTIGETHARVMVAEMMLALAGLHARGVAHG